MEEHISKILYRIKNVKLIAYLLIIVLIINGLGNLTDNIRKTYRFISDAITYMTKADILDEQLAKEAIDLSRNIIGFIIDRGKNEPPSEYDFDGILLEYEKHIYYSLGTQDMFNAKYVPSIVRLRNEFIKRGLRDKDIDNVIRVAPRDYLLIAYKLHYLANQVVTQSNK